MDTNSFDALNYHYMDALIFSFRRRFAPKELVFALLDSLSYLKMNVFHFHLSDYCRYSVESEV